MDRSRLVSEFCLQKRTPATLSPPEPLPPHSHSNLTPCLFCSQHLVKVAELRKREVILELQNEQLKQEKAMLERERDELIAARVLTFGEYQQKMDEQSGWNREDLQAQLFEAKIIIELLLVSKGVPTHPRLQQLDADSLKQKYSDLLLENLRLQERVMVRDRIISQRGFFPIYHYDQRVSILRKAVVHWYRKAEEECIRMRTTCKNLKLGITHQMENMRQLMNQQIESAKMQLVGFLEENSKKSTKEKKGRNEVVNSAQLGRKDAKNKDIISKVEAKRIR